MSKYEVIAFYKASENEVRVHAERFAGLYGLELRFEQLPLKEEAITDYVGEYTVVCMFNRDPFSVRKLLKYVYRVMKPALIFSNSYSTEAYNFLKVPVGYLSENKEKVVWANFFQRNNSHSDIELLIPREKDEQIAGMVNDNVCFIENIFGNSRALYKKTYVELEFEKLLEHAFRTQENSVVFLMRPFRVFSFFIPYYLRIYKRYAHTQILIIPRDDELYIPCH